VKIPVGVDGSDGADAAVRWVCRPATDTGAEVMAVPLAGRVAVAG